MKYLLVLALAAALPACAFAQDPRPLALTNAGFEEGRAGWNLPGNAAVVTDQAFAGKQSARLTVADPSKDNVYITRQVPVTGGTNYAIRCRVKTAGVAKSAGRMSSVGAGLIVEWADPQGKWYASGGYATGLYGDHDWTQCELRGQRAPEQAGFAVIFLALRGTGTAWFDDVEIAELPRSLTSEGPADGQALADNTPTFSWREDVRAARFLLEVSADPAFPEGKTIRLESDETRITLAQPLAPGRWCWRVSAPGYAPSAPRSFQQTAPADKDTAAPAIQVLPTRVTSADEVVRVRIREGGQKAPTVQAVLGGTPLKVQVAPAAAGEVDAILSGPWQPGLNRVALSATDAAGNRAAEALIVLNRPLPERPVRITPDGAYTDAGRRVFPLGIYQVTPTEMPRVKQAGFEVVHVYQFEGSRDDKAAAAYLDAAQANGLRAFIGFDRGRASGSGLTNGNKDHVIDRVAALCAHPGLFCWYLFDEPESAHQYVSPRALIAYANLIRRLDPYHPVVVTTWGPRMALYRPSFDTHWTQAYTTPEGVVSQIDEHRKLLGPETPITLIVHCFDREQTERVRQGGKPDIAHFEPDAAWLRAAPFAGITQRVNGMWWWWYAAETKEYVTAAQVPEAWQALSRVVGQIKDLQPVLADAAPAERGSVNVGGAAVTWWSKRVGGETTLIAVNTSTKAVRAKVPAAGDGPARVLYEDRQIQRQAGAITDDFERYGVHIYRYRE